MVRMISFPHCLYTSQRLYGKQAHKRSKGNPALSAAGTKPSEVKVSASGHANALFQECLERIRSERLEKDPDVHTKPSNVIASLTQAETELTRRIFHRLREVPNEADGAWSPQKDLEEATLDASRKHGIDPYWDPFHEVDEAKQRLNAEFSEFAKIVSAAEARRIKVALKKSLSKGKKRFDSFSTAYREWMGREVDEKPPVPTHVDDSFWVRTELQRQLAAIGGDMYHTKFRWRDVDILQHFRAPNGYILPRRVTKLTKKKQMQLVQSIKIAQYMALIPFDWNSLDYETMPLMDPLQWVVARMVKRAQVDGDGVYHPGKIVDKRAEAMLHVMANSYAPNLDYRGYMKLLQHNKVMEQDGQRPFNSLTYSQKLKRFRELANVPH